MAVVSLLRFPSPRNAADLWDLLGAMPGKELPFGEEVASEIETKGGIRRLGSQQYSPLQYDLMHHIGYKLGHLARLIGCEGACYVYD
jgi:hypothetical protein